MVKIDLHGLPAGEPHSEPGSGATSRPSEGAARRAADRAESRRADARLVAEQRLQHRYEMLASRAAAPLTPSAWNVWQRAHSTLAFQATLHAQKFGSSPLSSEQLEGLKNSTGTEQGAYGVARTLRLGNVGQRAGYEHSWRELVRIERELRRIEKTIDKQSKFQQSASGQANLQRSADAIYTPRVDVINARRQHAALGVARSRIAAGTEGTSPARVRAGRVIGTAMEGIEAFGEVAGPAIGAAVGIAGALAFGPPAIDALVASFVGKGQPFRDWSIANNRLGLAGRWRGRDLNNLTMRRSGIVTAPGTGLAPAFSFNDLRQEPYAFGLSPQDVTGFAARFGVPFRSGRSALNYAESLRMASLAPGMGLSEAQLSSAATQAQTVFQMSPEKFFRDLGKVQILATREGLDRSSVAAAWKSVASIAGQGAAPVNEPSLNRWLRRMLASGSPMMRTGEGERAYLSGMNATLSNLPEHMPASVAMSLFFKKQGVPTTGEALRRKLGISKSEWAKTTSGAGKLALQGFLAAEQRGDTIGAYSFLGILLQSNPQAWNRILGGGGLPTSDRDYGPRIRATATGVPLAVELAREQAPAVAPGAGKMAPMIPPAVLKEAAAMSAKYGIRQSTLLALWGGESGLNPRAVNGNAAGIGQVKPAALHDFNIAHGTSYSSADLTRLGIGGEVSAWYYATMRAKFGDRDLAIGHYNAGAGGKVNAGYVASFENYRGQYATVGNILRKEGRGAEGQAAQLAGSRYEDRTVSFVQEMGDQAAHVVGSFKLLDRAGHALHDVLTDLAKAVVHAFHSFEDYGHPAEVLK